MIRILDTETFYKVLLKEFSDDVMVHWNGDHWHLHVGDHIFTGRTLRGAAIAALIHLYARRARAVLN